MLHERLSHTSADRLNREEVTVISSVLDLNETLISSIMTPISKLFTLSFDDCLDDITRYNILSAGYSNIPIYLPDHPTTFVGVLSANSLVALTFKDEVTVGQLSLDGLPVVPADESCQTIFNVFRDRRVQMVLVTDRGTPHGEPSGFVTARDVMDELIGE
jgi:metal transporter CNNM